MRSNFFLSFLVLPNKNGRRAHLTFIGHINLLGDINFFVSVLFLLLLCFKYTSVIIAVSNNMIFYHEVKKLETFLFSLENNSELKQLRRRPQRRLQKKKIGLMIKTTALHACITLLSTFLWCPLHDYEVKPPTHLMHYGGRGHTTTNFPSPFRTSIKSSRIQIQENAPAFDLLSGSK